MTQCYIPEYLTPQCNSTEKDFDDNLFLVMIETVNTFHYLRLKRTMFRSMDLPQSLGGMGKGENLL
jgi:hypothetical protein